MKTNESTNEVVENGSASKVEIKAAIDKAETKLPRKKKKKNKSAFAAAAMGRSAMAQVDAHAYRDANFQQTGTNLSYREEI
jgi:hypothetical protein